MREKLAAVDLQDVLLLLGVSCLVGGVGMIHGPSAFILLGLLFFAAVYAIERSKSAPENKPVQKREKAAVEDLPPGIVNR